ncbi:MAG: nucleoside 2-deoxyribosyltransferase domain-containing protein [Bacilli bacterium]|nr:nucleoside 2-deoxyribosyltransferase domain-containing protein [Bacilli bacterium]
MEINYSDQEVVKRKKSIFLAGPTPRGENAKSWRTEACRILEELGFDGVVYVPEYSSWKPKEDYVDQAMWERIGLTEATVILFWIPRSLPEMAGFTTNVEFGYWLHSNKVIYGRPDGAPKTKYLDWLYELDYNRKPYNNLKELLEAAVKEVNEKETIIN